MTDFLDGSPAVINVGGFTFNGVDADGVKWTLEKVSGWDDGPAVDVDVAQRVVSHGAFAQPGRRGGRTITISGQIQAPTHGHLAAATRRFATILAGGEFGVFEFIDEDLGSLWTLVQLLQTPDVSWDAEPLTVKYQLSFHAPSAYRFGIVSEGSTAFASDGPIEGVVVRDSFNRDDAATLGSPDVGFGEWIVEQGSVAILDNQARFTAGVAADWCAFTTETHRADVTVEMTIPVMSTADGFSGIKVRSAGDNTGFQALDNQMYEAVAGNPTVGPAFSETFVSGDRMRVVTAGTTITVYRQAAATGPWVEVMTTTSSSYQSNTRHGGGIFHTSATDARFEDFTVSAPGGAGLVFPLFPDGVLDFGPLGDVGQAAVTNLGNAAAPIRFTITGPTPTAGFIITDTVTGDRIQYLGQVAEGATLVIDTGAGSALINGTADRGGDLIIDGPWPTIPPGETRAFLFEPNGSPTASTLTVEVTATYW